MAATEPSDPRLAYHDAADRFGADLDVAEWVERLRSALPPTRRTRAVVLWRGQAADRPHGMSWTTRRAPAEHYARCHVTAACTVERRDVETVVLRAVASPAAVIACAHPRAGDPGEVIVDPRLLTDVETVCGFRVDDAGAIVETNPRLQAWIAEEVSKMPPLPEEARARLAVLLWPGGAA
jgi:hypothetical protein